MSDELLGKVDTAALALLELAQQGGTNEEKIPYPERVVAFREVAKWAEFRAKTAPKAPVAESKIAGLRSQFHGTVGTAPPKRRRSSAASSANGHAHDATAVDGSPDPAAPELDTGPASTH
jgi:hypothetical protein